VVGDGVAVGVGVEVDSAGKTALPSGQGLGGSPPATDASTRVSFGVTSFVTIETSPSAAAWVDPFCALSSRTCHPNCTGDALGLWNVQVKFDPADAGLAAAPVANVKVFGQVALTAKAAWACALPALKAVSPSATAMTQIVLILVKTLLNFLGPSGPRDASRPAMFHNGLRAPLHSPADPLGPGAWRVTDQTIARTVRAAWRVAPAVDIEF
jgi:hypothetical protein